MSVLNPQKTLSTANLSCDGKADVTLSFEALPEFTASPADIVLVMDRSGSMGGTPMLKAKAAAKHLIDTVALASGSADGSTIDGGSHLLFASFAEDVTRKENETGTDVAELYSAVDSMVASGKTNHSVAFIAAENILAPYTNPRKIMILFTDGKTTLGSDPDVKAEQLKQAGVEIYCIGLLDDDAALKRWATDPDSTHVSSTNDPDQLDRVFSQIAGQVVKAGALNAVIKETLNPDFKIVGIRSASHGTALVLDPQNLRWEVGVLGASAPETATLTFEVMHIGLLGGEKPVNASVVYEDQQAQTLEFPSPLVTVNCSASILYPEPCPLPAAITVDGCRDAVNAAAGNVMLTGLGRIVQVDAVIKNVCPGKQIAAAVILTETDANGIEHARGTKTMLIPAQGGEACQDIMLKCVSFVVPESLSPDGITDSICADRHFAARVLANYVDTDFSCCDPEAVIL